jgi:predicted ATPase/DNA-binding SARP family transcriptional activator
MDFRILGPLEVRDGGGGSLPLGATKPRAVLAVLLLHANEPVNAERLAVALWGEEAPTDATRTVQVYVSRLRKALGDTEVIATTPAGYRLRVGADELDAERFRRSMEAGRLALGAGLHERAAALLREALGFWRGPPLADLEFEPFAQVEIARLDEQRLVALEARAEADLARGLHVGIVSELQQLHGEYPTREHLADLLMLALYRNGRQAEALTVYRDTRSMLVEDAGVEPGPELQRRHEAILRQDPSLDAEEAVSPDEPVTGASDRHRALPAAPNRTIGRGREVGSLSERLRVGSVRLLTLTGPGGVGKTRLALDAARTVQAHFADGARFVSLAAVQRPEDVAAAIVTSLGTSPLAGESADAAVERFLAAKHLLLVVDNCEHLPGAAAFIGGLAVACPAVTVLATSREPLAVQAEQCYRVAPLGLPERGTGPKPMSRAAAVALFCERARAHDSGFDADEDNIEAIAEICRRVDGLPLAIELAAARCGLFSPEEIATRLDGTLDELGAAPRDAPDRQQTLRATIDWSHSLLLDDEKACFARFAVFAGGATVEAAETVTGARIGTLDRLVAKSLIVRRQRAHNPSRLRMLETIRVYAADRFAAVAECASVRERHYRYYLALAQHHATDRALLGPNVDEHLACLDGETENLRAALDWAAQRDEAGQILELSVALLEYWMRRNRFAEAVAWVEPALRKPGATSDPRLRARALTKLSWTLWPLGRGTEEPALLEEAEAIARALAEPALLAEVLHNRAVIMSLEGRRDAASLLADEALAWAKASGDPWLVAKAAWSKLHAASNVNELREHVDETASLLEVAGNVYHHASVFQMVGYSLLRNGCDDEATRYLQMSVPLVLRLNDRYLWTSLRQKVGLAALFTGDTDAAVPAFREQLALCRELVVLPAASRGLAGLAAIAGLRDNLERAARLTGAAAAHRYGETQDSVDARLDATFLEPARARFSADAWDTALREGAALSFEDAIAYALDEPDPRSASPH